MSPNKSSKSDEEIIALKVFYHVKEDMKGSRVVGQWEIIVENNLTTSVPNASYKE